jgi:hypothetical protein
MNVVCIRRKLLEWDKQCDQCYESAIRESHFYDSLTGSTSGMSTRLCSRLHGGIWMPLQVIFRSRMTEVLAQNISGETQ